MEIDESLCTKCDLCLNVKPRADCIIKVRAFTYDETGKISGYQRATDEDKKPRIWISQAASSLTEIDPGCAHRN